MKFYDWLRRKSGLVVPTQKASFGGHYLMTLLREGKVIDEWEGDNICVNEGLNSNLNVNFANASQITNWYIGLFSGNYTPVATDGAATIAGNSTEVTQYTAGSRQAFLPALASGQSSTNSASRASFTFNANVTVYGAFLISSAVINGTSGVLFSAAQFATPKACSNNDQLLVTYTLNASSA
jgi:hypothetical protein